MYCCCIYIHGGTTIGLAMTITLLKYTIRVIVGSKNPTNNYYHDDNNTPNLHWANVDHHHIKEDPINFIVLILGIFFRSDSQKTVQQKTNIN